MSTDAAKDTGDIERVVVFGATGRTGRAVVDELLDHGYEVTAFARSPENVTDRHRHDRLRVVGGDVLVPADVERAMAGQDAVVIALGLSASPLRARLGIGLTTPIDVCSRGTRNVLDAIEFANGDRLVCESAWGVGETRESPPWYVRLLYRLLLKDVLADKEVQEAMIRRSGTEWVIVQPVSLTDGPATDAGQVRFDGTVRGSRVSRTDVAHYCVEAIETDEYVHRTATVS